MVTPVTVVTTPKTKVVTTSCHIYTIYFNALNPMLPLVPLLPRKIVSTDKTHPLTYVVLFFIGSAAENLFIFLIKL